MALIDRMTGWAGGARAIDAAEAALRRSWAEGLPDAVELLPPRPRAGFDRLVDALNRLPRPMTVLGTLALLATAVVAPEWFATRMDSLGRMPEGLWWVVGAVLSLHFGARVQAHRHAHEREIVEAVVRGPAPAPALEAESPAAAEPGSDAAVVLGTLKAGPNAALAEWKGATTQP